METTLQGDQQNVVMNNQQQKLHIEAPGCTINVCTGLTHTDDSEVTAIEIIADGKLYTGQHSWRVAGVGPASTLNVRVVRSK